MVTTLAVRILVGTVTPTRVHPYISYEIVSVNGINIFYVACKQSTEPCYLNGQDFYVRTNPATDKLEGPKLVSYVQNHFIL
jgi:hypothetical protein